jgi:cellobiose phosphorylase
MSWENVLKRGIEDFPEEEQPKVRALLHAISVNEGEHSARNWKEYYLMSGTYWSLHEHVMTAADKTEEYTFPKTLPDGTEIDWDEIF